MTHLLLCAMLVFWVVGQWHTTVAGAQRPEPAGRSDYTVGAQDVLNITVFDEPQLSGRHRVDSDGTFTFPFVGRVAARGLTLRAIEANLIKLLADGYLRRPQLTVEVEQYRSQSVFIMGEVRNPGKYSLTGDMSLIEALVQAGSLTGAAGNEVLILHPKAEGGRSRPVLPSEGGGAAIVRVNIKDIESGMLSQNVSDFVIRDGDTIFVPKAEKFYVIGQVRTPGSYVIERGMTVLQAISLAGGVTDRGSNRRVKIVRIVDGRKKEIDAKPTDFVQPGDTIVVRQRLL